jgi:hypothetical protein
MLCTSSNAGKRVEFMSEFMPAKRGDGGATGRRRFGIEMSRRDCAAEMKSASVNFIVMDDGYLTDACYGGVKYDEFV